MIPTINFNAILADPLLLIAVSLLILGPLVFLVALVKFFRSGKKSEPLPPLSDEFEPEPLVTPSYIQEIKEEAAPPAPEIEQTSAPMEKERPPMPTISGEVEGQVEIVFSQIKTLSRKVAQLESEMETVSRTASAKLEANELKEVPMNPADFTQKLLKLAEHVIVLEKDVARLKAGARNNPPANGSATASQGEPGLPAQPSAPSGPRPPVMPI